MNDVYVALIEVLPLSGCTLCPADTEGAFARCYGVADDAEAAELRFRLKLAQERFGVVEVEWCIGVHDAAWEEPDSEEGNACIHEASESGEVVLGRLDTWAAEEE